MALNYPGPFELRMFYTCVSSGITLSHVARYNLDCDPAPSPGEAFSTILAKKAIPNQTPATIPLDDAVDAWVTLFKALFNTTTTITHAELWAYEPESFDAAFVSTYDIAVAGSSGTAVVACGQTIHTYRTVDGGIMKMSFMESILALGSSTALGAATGAQAAVRDHVLGNDNIFLGRDTSRPFAALKVHPGQNEALFKKRFRTA